MHQTKAFCCNFALKKVKIWELRKKGTKDDAHLDPNAVLSNV